MVAPFDCTLNHLIEATLPCSGEVGDGAVLELKAQSTESSGKMEMTAAPKAASAQTSGKNMTSLLNFATDHDRNPLQGKESSIESLVFGL